MRFFLLFFKCLYLWDLEYIFFIKVLRKNIYGGVLVFFIKFYGSYLYKLKKVMVDCVI